MQDWFLLHLAAREFNYRPIDLDEMPSWWLNTALTVMSLERDLERAQERAAKRKKTWGKR